MEPLKPAETVKMIQARLESWQVENPFTPEALAEIHRLSHGVPRSPRGTLKSGRFRHKIDDSNNRPNIIGFCAIASTAKWHEI
jgi:hypothetical protein